MSGISKRDMANTKPLIVTKDQLDTLLSRYTLGWKWADDAILELWHNGTPIPQPWGRLPRKMILPSQLRVWVHDVGTRGGFDIRIMGLTTASLSPR